MCIRDSEACLQAVYPVFVRNRPEVVEAAELAEGRLARREEISHQMLDAAGEQQADAGAALEDCPHSFRQGVGISVWGVRAGDLLELIEEDHHSLLVRFGDPTG